MAQTREVTEGIQYQGEDEKVVYTVTTTPWGSDPSAPVAVLKDPDGEDVSATNLTGAATVSGDIITSPLVHSLTAGELYRMEVLFVTGGRTLECFFDIMAQV